MAKGISLHIGLNNIDSPSSRGLVVRALLGSTELLYLFCKQCTESEFRASKRNYLITKNGL